MRRRKQKYALLGTSRSVHTGAGEPVGPGVDSKARLALDQLDQGAFVSPALRARRHKTGHEPSRRW